MASGNHLLEAIVHGLCEVIERNAIALWEISDEIRVLDLGTVDDPYCVQTIEWLTRAGVHVIVPLMSDLTRQTSILKTPSFGIR